jgi:hypothetical protein
MSDLLLLGLIAVFFFFSVFLVGAIDKLRGNT